MSSPSYIPSFYFSKFAQELSSPYTSLEAYRNGTIDQSGNIIKPESSIDPLEYFVIKLKKIFDELPYGTTKAKLNNYMSTLQLFGEEASQFGITEPEYIGLVESYLALNCNPELSYIELLEDMATGAMATPAPAPGANSGGVSGYDPPMGLTRRPLLKGLENCEMFDVCPEEMRAFKSAKAWKHVPDSETKRYLQRYQRRNPNGKMGLRSVDPDTGASSYYWIDYKQKSFLEEYGLNNLDFLTEQNEDSNSDNSTSLKVEPSHLDSVAHIIKNIFSIGAKERDDSTPPILLNPTAEHSHVSELQARLLSLGHGIDHISKIEDPEHRSALLNSFIDHHVRGSTKSPSTADRIGGKSNGHAMPDTHFFDPESKQVVGGEVKTAKSTGSLPTKWNPVGEKRRSKEWAKSNIEGRELEKTGIGGYSRIKLIPQLALGLSIEAGRQLARFGKKSGPKTIVKASNGNFYVANTGDVIAHWAKGINFPSVKAKSRGKEQEQSKPETAGQSMEYLPLTGFINNALRGKSDAKVERLTISKAAYDMLKNRTHPEHHAAIEKLLLPHVK